VREIQPCLAAHVCNGAGRAAQAWYGITANFGNLSIITYYTRKTDGLHVVSTARVGDSDCAPVFRVTSVLLPDQEVVISIPQPLGAEPLELRLVREGDTIRQVPAQIDHLGAAD
jgi:hypothetical protein